MWEEMEEEKEGGEKRKEVFFVYILKKFRNKHRRNGSFIGVLFVASNDARNRKQVGGIVCFSPSRQSSFLPPPIRFFSVNN